MVRAAQNNVSWSAILGMIACGSALAPATARAQERDAPPQSGEFSSQDVGNINFEARQDNGVPGQNPDQAAPESASQGVVRLARFTMVKGNVTWRADDGLEWSQATANLPLRQGAQIWVTDGGRAEVQFDDGSVLRLGNGALVTLKTLFSDADGEFTQIVVNEGLVNLRARHERGVYRLDTPLVGVTARGPAKLRLGIADGVELAIREGQANIEGSLGKATLQSGDYLDLRDANTPYDPARVPREDSWDQWNDDQDRLMDEGASRPSHQYLPANISIVATNLDDYGSWHDDTEYGHVWCPRVEATDWRPYYHGHWTWVNPFGWTWVSDEAWGWAPYHYGTWVSRPYGWAWCPGPVNQYWSPAVVHFSEYDGRVAWCPLAPREVHYPSFLSIGFRSGNWSAFFSIGQAAVYYPTNNAYCVARPFNTTYVNHVTYVNNIHVTNIYNNNPGGYFAANHNTYLQNGQGNRFIPYNARLAAGVTTVATAGFAGRTAFQALPRETSRTAFAQGRMVSAPPAGSRPVAGPQFVQPTRTALTPMHAFAGNTQPPAAALNRSVYRAPLPANIAQRALPITPAGVTVNNPRSEGRPTANGGFNTGRPTSAGNPTGRTPASAGLSGRTNGSTYNSAGTSYPRNGGVNGSGQAANTANGGQSPRTVRPPYDPNSRASDRAGAGYRPSGSNSGSSAAQAAAQARASLGQTGGRASSGNATTSGSGRTYGGGNGSGSRGDSNSGSGTSRPYQGGNEGRTPRYGSGGAGTTYPRTGGSDTGASPRTSDGTRPGYTPPAYTPPTRPGGTTGTSGSGSERSGGRTYEPRTYSPPVRTNGDTGTRTYSPPPRTSSSNNTPAAPPRTYTPPPARERPAPPPAQGGHSSGDSKDNKDKDKKDKGKG